MQFYDASELECLQFQEFSFRILFQQKPEQRKNQWNWKTSTFDHEKIKFIHCSLNSAMFHQFRKIASRREATAFFSSHFRKGIKKHILYLT